MSKIDISGIVYPMILVAVTLMIGAIVFARVYPKLYEPLAPEPNVPDQPTTITAARHNHLGLWIFVLFAAFRPELYKLFLKVIKMEMKK